jgi:excisionase family DNA binding protein
MKAQSPQIVPQLLTPHDVCTRWQISAMTLHRWRQAGKVRTLKMGRGVRIPMEEVLRIEAESVTAA